MKTVQKPDEVWGEISANLEGSYPDGHYNLVRIGERSRYLPVEVVNSAPFKATKKSHEESICDLCTH